MGMAATFEQIKARLESTKRYAQSQGYALAQPTQDIETLIEMVEALKLCAHPVPEVAAKSPLVCFFDNEADREEFRALIVAAKPGMRAVKVP